MTLGDFTDVAGYIADAYVASLAPGSVLDSLALYAKVLPRGLRHATLASSEGVAQSVAEGGMKVAKRLTFGEATATAFKVAEAVVATNELINAQGPAILDIFSRELQSAVTRACNAAVLANLVDSSSATVTATSDALSDLRAALRAADPSTGYVYVAPAGVIADLATRVENRGAGVAGGEFVPGVSIVPASVDHPTLIPADQIVIRDEGILVSPPAQHASLSMAETPSSPSTVVSMWQTNSTAVLVERSWLMDASRAHVVVVG
jgi:hypothetical protein